MYYLIKLSVTFTSTETTVKLVTEASSAVICQKRKDDYELGAQ